MMSVVEAIEEEREVEIEERMKGKTAKQKKMTKSK